ncbi:MAG: hypothetical protein IKV92_08775 [Akkermansia sp.]|nr:hypothetical protein [Akkermansia sp.]
MSPSDVSIRRKRWILVLFCLITLGSIVLFAPSGDMYVDEYGDKHVPGFFNDAVITYADQISGSQPVTDWHCALYMYEGRVMHSLLEAVTAGEVDGILPQRVFMWVADMLLLANLAYWLALLLRRDVRWGWMALPLGGSMVLLHIGLGVSLDYFFCTCVFSAVSLSMVLYLSERKLVWVLCGLGLVVLMWHMVEYRRNAALLLPIFMYLLTARWMLSCRIPLKATVAAVFTLVLYVVATRFIALCALPVVHKPSMAPMVESDLRIAAVLENERVAEWARLKENGLPVYEHEYCDSITAYWGGADVNTTDWDRVWAYYLHAWKTNTGNMLMARVLQLSQFYWSGSTPWIVEVTADAMYPQMADNHKRWQTLKPTDIEYLYLRILRLGVTLASICLCLRYVWLWLVKRRELTAEQYLLMIITGVATSYSLSYVVVTPTSDFRYLLPAQMLGCIVLCYLWIKRLIANTVNK